MRQKLFAMVVMSGLVLATGAVYAQAPTPSPAAQQKPEPAIIPLKVTIVITRYKSDKAQTMLSRIPFEVWINTGGSSTIRSSSEVPVPSTTISKDEAQNKTTAVASFTYRSVGTSLTVSAAVLADGRFSIPISIEDSQIIPTPVDSGDGMPKVSAQQLRTQTTVIVRDGQTVQHSLSTDRVTGDLTKVDVTLNVVK